MSTTEPALPRCYRHPDRETGRNCTRCGAKAARPDARTRAKLVTSSVLTPVTYAIIGLNVLVFLWMGVQDSHTFAGNITEAHYNLGLNKQMLMGGVINWNLDGVVPDHQWYRLVTAGFIHFGVFHIAMNMLLLFQLGQLLERALGGTRFALLYGASLLGGSLGVLLLDANGISGGASGAVFGLMAGAAIGLHRRGVNVFTNGIATTSALNLVLTFTVRGISIGGHLGGAVAGLICGWVMLAPSWRPVPKWATYALPVGVMAVSVLMSMAVVG